jgi:hypothetical protein
MLVNQLTVTTGSRMARNRQLGLATSFEIRELAGSAGGLVLALHAEGHAVARAELSATSLLEMEQTSATARAEVRALLEAALVKRLDELHASVQLGPLKEVPIPGGMRLVSTYVHQDVAAIVAGAVWFDPSANVTGDESVHPIVRSKMRFASLRRLTERSPSAFQFIVSFLDEMSS